MIDWCADATPNSREGGGSCDSVPSPRGQPDWRPVNRHTLSWNVAAAWWAYAYTQLSTLPGARVVGQVIPTPSHLLDRSSIPRFARLHRGGSNEPQAGTQGRETVARGSEQPFRQSG